MTAPAPDWRASLETVFDDEMAAAMDLLAALKAEREALKGRDLDALSASGEKKVGLLVALERLETERRELLALAGLPVDGHTLLDCLGPADTVAVRWQRILGLLAECRTLNEANGRLVAVQRARIEQALGVIRGDGSAPVYGPDGNRRGGRRGNAIASA